jgi:hypothetical protein
MHVLCHHGIDIAEVGVTKLVKTSLKVMIQVFWDMTSSRLVNSYRRFGEACDPACFHLRGLDREHGVVGTQKTCVLQALLSKLGAFYRLGSYISLSYWLALML